MICALFIPVTSSPKFFPSHSTLTKATVDVLGKHQKQHLSGDDLELFWQREFKVEVSSREQGSVGSQEGPLLHGQHA